MGAREAERANPASQTGNVAGFDSCSYCFWGATVHRRNLGSDENLASVCAIEFLNSFHALYVFTSVEGKLPELAGFQTQRRLFLAEATCSVEALSTYFHQSPGFTPLTS